MYRWVFSMSSFFKLTDIIKILLGNERLRRSLYKVHSKIDLKGLNGSPSSNLMGPFFKKGAQRGPSERCSSCEL